MEFEWEPDYRTFRDELRAFIQEWRTPELLKEYAETYGGGGDLIHAFHQACQLARQCIARRCSGIAQFQLDTCLAVGKLDVAHPLGADQIAVAVRVDVGFECRFDRFCACHGRVCLPAV